MSVTVIRGLGDIPGDSIVSEILTTEDLQRERAEFELNANSSDRISQQGTMIGMIECNSGDTVQIQHQGDVHYGYIENSSIVINMEGGYNVTTSVNIELVDE